MFFFSDTHDDNDELEEERMNYELYNSVDFSKTCSPCVNDVVEHRMNHSEDFVNENTMPTPEVLPVQEEEEGTESDSNGNVVGDVSGMDTSNETITKVEVSSSKQMHVKQTLNLASNSSVNHGPVHNAQSGQQSDNYTINGPKSRQKVLLSDLTVFQDAEEPPSPIIVSSYEELVIPNRMENDETTTPWVQSRYKGNRYVYESSQSSEGDGIHSDDQTVTGCKQSSTPGVGSYQSLQGYSRGRGYVYEHSSSVKNNGYVGGQCDRYDNKPCNRGFPPPYMNDAAKHLDPSSRSCNAPQFSMGRGESPSNRGHVMTGRGIPLTNRNQSQSPGIPTSSKSDNQRGGRGKFFKNLRERVLNSQENHIEMEQTSHFPNSRHIPHELRGQTSPHGSTSPHNFQGGRGQSSPYNFQGERGQSPPHNFQGGRGQSSPHNFQGERGQSSPHSPTSPHNFQGGRGQSSPHGWRGQSSPHVRHGIRGQFSHKEQRGQNPPHGTISPHVSEDERRQTSPHGPNSHRVINSQGNQIEKEQSSHVSNSPHIPDGLRGQISPNFPTSPCALNSHHIPQAERGHTSPQALNSPHIPQGGRKQTSPHVPQGLRGQSPPRIRGRGEILKELLLRKQARNQQITS